MRHIKFFVAAGIIISLAAVVITENNIRNYNTKNYTDCISNCLSIGQALEIYANKNDGKYPSDLKIISQKYIDYSPDCPAAKADTYTRSYQVSDDHGTCTFYCSGHYHKGVGVEMDYPLYSSFFGVISAQNRMPKNEYEKVRLMIRHNPEKAKQYIRDNSQVINDVSLGDTLINDVINMQNVNVDMVRFIVENKADLTIRNRNRQTPLQRAKQLESLNSRVSEHSTDQADKHKKYQEIVKILEKAGAKE